VFLRQVAYHRPEVRLAVRLGHLHHDIWEEKKDNNYNYLTRVKRRKAGNSVSASGLEQHVGTPAAQVQVQVLRMSGLSTFGESIV
jgi:hypothetical protein